MADFNKSANALFLEHYGDLLRQGYPPSEARRRAHDDWIGSLDEFNGLTVDDLAQHLMRRVDEEGRRLHAESFTKHVDRISVLKGLRLALIDLLDWRPNNE